jgi:hypothetical protein
VCTTYTSSKRAPLRRTPRARKRQIRYRKSFRGNCTPARGPLTARGRLEIANRQLRAAVDNLEQHHQTVGRLRESINAVGTTENELEVHRQAHLAQQGQWLANGGRPDQRPAEPVELRKAEQRLIDAQRAGAAARSVIADHEATLTEAARHVAAMTAARDDAHRVLHIVREHIDAHYLPAMLAAREFERNIWNTYDALRASGDDRTAAAIAQALRDAKGKLATTPTAEPARGKAFLDALMRDPSAELGSAQ